MFAVLLIQAVFEIQTGYVCAIVCLAQFGVFKQGA